MGKVSFFALFIASLFIISCSSKSDGSLFGDFKQTPCTGDNCTNSSQLSEPSFERDDNSDVILGKYDNTLEVSGRCTVTGYSDNQISITVTPSGAGSQTLSSGYTPIVGVTTGSTSSTSGVAKCEKGRWGVAIHACQNGLGTAGIHQIDLVLNGLDSSGRKIDIKDGLISFFFNRTVNCDASIVN